MTLRFWPCSSARALSFEEQYFRYAHLFFSARPLSVIDVQLVVHSSVTSPDEQLENASHLKTWIKQLIDRFYVGQYYSKFGLTTYAAGQPTLELGSYQELSKGLHL